MLEEEKARRLRWFSGAVTVILIIVCNAFLLLGLWMSGINLDAVLSTREFYDPAKAYCVRTEAMQVKGIMQSVRICTEWLELADATGAVHTIHQGEPLEVGQDGKLRYQRDASGDYRLVWLLLFVILVLVSGMWMKSMLVTWYRLRLAASEL